MVLFLDAVKPAELILIVVIVLLLFGGKKIPELMRGLGQGIREFKESSKGIKEEEQKKKDDATPTQVK
jgi:sec-independent protein translocase protein TatA